MSHCPLSTRSVYLVDVAITYPFWDTTILFNSIFRLHVRRICVLMDQTACYDQLTFFWNIMQARCRPSLYVGIWRQIFRQVDHTWGCNFRNAVITQMYHVNLVGDPLFFQLILEDHHVWLKRRNNSMAHTHKYWVILSIFCMTDMTCSEFGPYMCKSLSGSSKYNMIKLAGFSGSFIHDMTCERRSVFWAALEIDRKCLLCLFFCGNRTACPIVASVKCFYLDRRKCHPATSSRLSDDLHLHLRWFSDKNKG